MPESKPSIVEGHVPIMAMTALDLRRLLGRRTTRNGDLQRVILRDPAAAIGLFRYVRRLRRDAYDDLSDAGHAVSMIGFDALRRLLRQLPELAPGERDWLAPEQPFQSSLGAHAAFYARLFARQYGLSGPDEVATAALVQDPAVLALWSTEPEEAAYAARLVRARRRYDEAFGERLGEPLAEANLRVAAAWGLPSLAVEAMGDWSDMDRRARLVRLCADLARATAYDWHSLETAARIEGLAELLHRPLERVTGQLHRASVQAARDLRPVGYPVTAFSRLYLPTTDGVDAASMAGLASADPDKRIDAALLDTLQRLLTEAGLQRVTFVAYNRVRGQLRTHLALEVDPQNPLYSLTVPSSERNLFSLLIAKPQAVWLNATNRARYETFLTSELNRALRTDNCFAMSVFASGAPLGLFYADGPDLSGEGYATFRRLIRRAGQRLNPAVA